MALSARLDGEDTPAERARADTHLAGCARCRQWLRDATEVTRLVRAARLDTDSPGVPDGVLAGAPGGWRGRAALALRWLLGGLGVAQFVLGMTQISALASDQHTHPGQVAGAGHLWHESAAWNLAIGAAFAWIATRRNRPVGITPMLTAFLVVLTLLSLGDVVAGQVVAAWLLSHGFIVAGYAVILLLSRPGWDFHHPPADGGRPRRWRVREDPEQVPEPVAPRLRVVPDQPAAHRRAA